MKKLILSILISLPSLLSSGQISGGFFYGTDSWGNMFVYFKGTNISEYNIQIKIKCINEQLGQEKNWKSELSYGEYFTVGPSDNWLWQSGEKLIITYPNRSSYYWIYTLQQNNPNFMDKDIMTPSWMENTPDINNYNQFNFPNSTNTKTYRTKDEIDFQIAKIEKNLNDTRRIYENCSNAILKPSYFRIIQDYENMLQELRTERIYAK